MLRSFQFTAPRDVAAFVVDSDTTLRAIIFTRFDGNQANTVSLLRIPTEGDAVVVRSYSATTVEQSLSESLVKGHYRITGLKASDRLELVTDEG